METATDRSVIMFFLVVRVATVPGDQAWRDPRKTAADQLRMNSRWDYILYERLATSLLTILLAQLDADKAVQQMHRVAELIVCRARPLQSRR